MRQILLVGVVCCCTGCGGDTNDLGDVPDRTTLRLLGVAALDADDCTAWAGAAMRASGVMDELLTSQYQAALAVENTGDDDVAVRRAEVTVADTQGNELTAFSADAGGMALAGAASVTIVPLIPSPQGLPSHVTTTVSVVGETSSRTVESLPLTFPIRICSGCLIVYPASADDTMLPGYQCARPADTEPVAPCLFGQDEVVDCRLCATTIPECVKPD